MEDPTARGRSGLAITYELAGSGDLMVEKLGRAPGQTAWSGRPPPDEPTQSPKG